MKDKVKNIAIVILFVIIFGLLGICGYLLFFKDNKNTGNEEIFYTTADNKYKLEIVDAHDSTARKKAKEVYYNYFKDKCADDNTYLDYFDNITCNTIETEFDNFFKDSYIFKKYAYINDELLEVIEYDETNDLIALSADRVNAGGQCSAFNFIVNKKSKIIDKFNEGIYHFIKNDKALYITKAYCEDEGNVLVYTKDFKELGKEVCSNPDGNGNVIVKKNNVIYKYDESGKEIEKTSKFADVGHAVVYQDVFYIVVKENNKAYLLNLDTKEKTFITNRNDSYPLEHSTYVDIINDKIVITMYFDYEVTFTYDPITKKITK